jgi:hypothetical protein
VAAVACGPNRNSKGPYYPKQVLFHSGLHELAGAPIIH